ncbi:MAG TPA: N-acetylmuramoyl-L-alanine amidase [Stellaceae bacterium]|nr:N-acetylmuramoyl-L-alanine amidase [Stellaceae bacterium]
MIRERASPNHDARPEGGRIDMLVLHYTGMKTAAEAIDRLCDPAAKVSAHYVIDEDGKVWRLVEESRRAWHAGASFWQGTENVNAVSIGIELVNPGHEWGYRAFPEAQMASLETLAKVLIARHPIPADRVVGHSDVAPVRKQDPGELFDWPRLARGGVGLWPTEAAAPPADVASAQAMLAAIGYRVPSSRALDDETRNVLIAFQRRFRPTCIDGGLDAETAARLAAMARAVGALRADRRS